jgi:hypothetical protein
MIEQHLYQRLTGFAGLTALVATRVYPQKLPQEPTYPAVTYLTVSALRESAMSADPGVARRRFSVIAWGATFTSASDVAEQVRAALQRYKGTLDGTEVLDSYIVLTRDLYNDDAKVFSVVNDFDIAYRE